MPTNDFEKQVQQKMEELKFTPSEAVWLEVQKQIQPRRDRRRLLLWWLLLPLLAGGSFLYYYSGRTPASPGKEQALSPAGKQGNGPAIAGNTIVSNTNDNNNAHNNKGNIVDNPTNHRQSARRQPRQRGLPSQKHGNDKADNAAVENAETKGLQDAVAAGKNPLPVVAGNMPPEAADMKPSIVNAPGKGSYAARIQASPVVSPESQWITKLHPFKKRMEWVLSLRGGGSGISSGLAPLPKSTAAYDRLPGSFTSAAGVTPGGSGGSGNGGQYASLSSRPSDVKPGFSAGLGLSLRLFIHPKLSFEAGVMYDYYSTSMLVGRRDTSAQSAGQAYYLNYSTAAAARNENYINRYHFIEIPFRLQKQVGVRSPLSWQTGVSIGRLLGTNALQYDENSNAYYKDNNVFNKTQLTLSAGMDVCFLRDRPVSFEIGPRLQYGLSNFTKKEYYGSRHLLFAGLETRVFFRKK